MENLKDMFEMLYELLLPLLKIFIMIAIMGFFISGMVFFNIKIDENNLEETKYCPSCGIDLIKNY